MSPQHFHFTAMAADTPDEELNTEWHEESEQFLQLVYVYCNTSGSSAKIGVQALLEIESAKTR